MSEREADRSLEGAGADPMPVDDIDDEKWPIGFILTIVMVSLYLAYRLIQGVVLFVDWIF